MTNRGENFLLCLFYTITAEKQQKEKTGQRMEKKKEDSYSRFVKKRMI